MPCRSISYLNNVKNQCVLFLFYLFLGIKSHTFQIVSENEPLRCYRGNIDVTQQILTPYEDDTSLHHS